MLKIHRSRVSQASQATWHHHTRTMARILLTLLPLMIESRPPSVFGNSAAPVHQEESGAERNGTERNGRRSYHLARATRRAPGAARRDGGVVVSRRRRSEEEA